MKLRDWLERENVSFAEMAARIERTSEAVRRYALGERIPDRETMPKIVHATLGAVTANDFFDIEHLLDPADTAPQHSGSSGNGARGSTPAGAA